MVSQQQVIAMLAGSSAASRPAATDSPEHAFSPDDTAPSTWQATAVAAYALRTVADSADLRGELTARVQAVTGLTIPKGAVMVDHDERRATAAVDGVVLQLRGHNLILLRPCAHCGIGLFESLPLWSRADLGYALSDWRPYHAGCEPADPAEDADW